VQAQEDRKQEEGEIAFQQLGEILLKLWERLNVLKVHGGGICIGTTVVRGE
jgi:hypothetical protein